MKSSRCPLVDRKSMLNGSVREKWKGTDLQRKIFDGDCTTNLTCIWCVYNEKIVKNDSDRRK